MEKLIRFDWAIKKLLRNKANFDILEGFLSALLHEDVEVESLLESESNQENEGDKFNRVDLLVKNTKGELNLIEVQVESEYDFFHRLAYGTAKLLTEYIERGQAHHHLKKVISISVTYFNLGVGADYLYYGSTQFVGVHAHDTLALSEAQFGMAEVHKIFPEYYIIRVGRFPDQIHEAIDEWIYMLKHSEVRPEFTAKHIQDASEKLRVMNLDSEQRKAYEHFMENSSYQESVLWTSHEEGRRQERYEMARRMLSDRLPIETIAKYSGLPLHEIETLRDDASPPEKS